MTIWKFVLPVAARPIIAMPEGAIPCSVGAQGDDLCLWALVNPDPNHPKQLHAFGVFGTGHTLPERGAGSGVRFIGTALMHGGALVWHVWHEGVVVSDGRDTVEP